MIVTGQDDPEIANSAREIGHGYVIKPFGVHEISITVENALHRRRLELHNRSMVAELRELNETKDALIGAVSHDLRNPLTAIAGLAELMNARLERFSTEQVHGFLNDIVTAAGQMTTLVQGLLNRDRVARGVMVRERTDVGQLTEHVVGLLDPDGHELLLECPPLQVDVDATMVERIVDNLVSECDQAHAAGNPRLGASSSHTRGRRDRRRG